MRKLLYGGPVNGVVGPFILSLTMCAFPERDKLVLVEPAFGDPFFAKLTVIGENMPWPYWIISDSNYRKSHPMDLWCYYVRPNAEVQRPPADQPT